MFSKITIPKFKDKYFLSIEKIESLSNHIGFIKTDRIKIKWPTLGGYFYCPYIPIMQTPVVLDPKTIIEKMRGYSIT